MMNPENKQRVVGVIVLVAFIALLIPFLFTGDAKKRHDLATDIAIPDQPLMTESPKNIRPTLDVEQADSPQVVVENVTENLSPVIAVEEIPSSALSPEFAEKPDVFSAKMPDDSKPAVIAEETLPIKATVPEVKKPIAVKSSAAPAKAPAVSKLKAKPLKSKAVAKASKKGFKPHVIGKGKPLVAEQMFWSVQVGSFSDQSRMQSLVSKIQAQGFHVYLQKISTSNGPMVRILVGRESTKEKAAKMAAQLKTKLKLTGRIVGNKK